MKIKASFVKLLPCCIGLLCIGTLLVGAEIPNDTVMVQRIAQLRTRIHDNRKAGLADESGKPLVRAKILTNWNNRGDFTRYYNHSILDFSARALELGEQLAEVNTALQEMCQYHLERPQTMLEVHSFPSAVTTLARFHLRFGPKGSRAAGRLTPETCAVIEKTLWEWANKKARIQAADWKQSQTWAISESENHHASHVTSCWASALVLQNVPIYKNCNYKDGHTPAEHYQAWTDYLKEYLRQRACKGMFVEIDSPSYASAVVKCMLCYHDLSDDPVLKKRAGQLLELYWALWAGEQINAVTGGGQTRTYPKLATGGGSSLTIPAAYLLGTGDPGPFDVTYATTTWQAPDLVLKMIAGREDQPPYDIKERRMGLADEGFNSPPDYRLRTDFGGILRYTWCTPEFIMGSLATEARPSTDWTSISSKDRWSGVIFAGDRNARVFATPYNGESVLNGLWCAQAKGTMISQRLPATTEDSGKNRSTGWRVFISNAGLSRPVQSGPWTFAEAQRAYVGIRVVNGITKIEPNKRGLWLVCEDTLTPVIIEAGRKSDHVNFEAFQKAAISRPLLFQEGVLDYQSLAGDKLTFHTDRTRLPEINGTVVNLAPEKVYDSPFVQSGYDSGVVTIRYGKEERILNFNQ